MMPRARGFTLVELLVAISILAIVAVLGWRGLDGIIRSRKALTAQMEQTRGMQLTFAQMQSDCENLAPAALLHTRPYMLPEEGRLTLVRLVLTESEATRLQVVSYRLRDGVLTRRESTATRDLLQLDALWQAALGDTDPVPGVALQSGVMGMSLRIWQDNSWRAAVQGNGGSANGSNNTSTNTATNAPTGLEVSLQLQEQGQQGSSTIVKSLLLGAL